jgi:hypothetical protein
MTGIQWLIVVCVIVLVIWFLYEFGVRAPIDRDINPGIPSIIFAILFVFPFMKIVEWRKRRRRRNDG